MSKWRPDGWKNPNGIELVRGHFSDGREYVHDPEPEHDAYEAGADAMLEALKKTGLYGDEEPYWDFGPNFWGNPDDGRSVNIGNLDNYLDIEKGWLVFIPDEGEICK